MNARAAVAAALAAGSLVLAGCGPADVGTASSQALVAAPSASSSPHVARGGVPSIEAQRTTPAPVVRAPVPVPVPAPLSAPRTPAPQTTVHVPSPAPVPAPARTATPPVAPAAPAGSLGTAPIQKPPSGNFYKAGQFCPKVDAGKTTRDASGRTLLCTDNDGLRWEPA